MNCFRFFSNGRRCLTNMNSLGARAGLEIQDSGVNEPAVPGVLTESQEMLLRGGHSFIFLFFPPWVWWIDPGSYFLTSFNWINEQTQACLRRSPFVVALFTANMWCAGLRWINSPQPKALGGPCLKCNMPMAYQRKPHDHFGPFNHLFFFWQMTSKH